MNNYNSANEAVILFLIFEVSVPLYQAERREKEEGLGRDGKLNGSFVLGLDSVFVVGFVD